MAWIRLDDQIMHNPKVRDLLARAPEAFAFHIAGMCASASALTDGHIATRDLPLVAAEALVPESSAVSQLVEVGLWEPLADGYEIHDYLDYQPSRDQVLEARERDRKRKVRRRGRGDLRGGDEHGAWQEKVSGSDSARASPLESARDGPPDTAMEAITEASSDSASDSTLESDCPVPSPNTSVVSQSVSPTGREGDEPRATTDDDEIQRDDIIAQAIDIAAGRRIQRRIAAGETISDRVGYTAKTRHNMRTERGQELNDLAAQGLSAKAIADHLEPERPTRPATPRLAEISEVRAEHRLDQPPPHPESVRAGLAAARSALGRGRIPRTDTPADEIGDSVANHPTGNRSELDDYETEPF